MKRKMRVAAAILGLAVGVQAAVAAEATWDADVFSQYVWRGQVLNRAAVFQPALTVESDFGLSGGFWANMDLTDRNGTEMEISEVALWVSYALPLEGVFGAALTFTEYLFPNTDDEATRELELELALDVLLAPTLTLAHEIDAGSSIYAALSLGHAFDLGDRLELDLGGSIGWATAAYNRDYFEVDQAALNDVTLSLGLTASLSERCSLSLLTSFSLLPDSDVRDAAKEIFGADTAWVAGLRFSYRF